MSNTDSHTITIFLCGDVMTGRGIDQILPHPSDPHLHEPYVRNARRYVDLAEEANGVIPEPADFRYIWGDALAVLEKESPAARVINLETSITRSDDYWLGKGINYRMHPDNIPVLTAARIDVCALANNHVLDWGYAGLGETLQTLHKAGIKSAGVGLSLTEAEAPAIVDISAQARLLVFSCGDATSGIPESWGAAAGKPGVNLLPDLSDRAVYRIGQAVRAVKQPRDVAVVSIHWGGNWGYDISRDQRAFAHGLIDEAGVDVIHGHSSHHAKGIEVYRGRPVIYGCGDFINDYEGIGGYESFRGDLSLMYFVRMDVTSGKLAELRMKPMQMRKFRLNRASRQDAEWLGKTLDREGRTLGTRAELGEDNTLLLRWS
jgi:poly-gamma-glutamate synthesis protein (capsule biosynthesis protein)